MRFYLLCVTFLILHSNMQSQHNILDNPIMQVKVEECLAHTYNMDFKKAIEFQAEIEYLLPGHPVSSFLRALIIYWENFPLLPEENETDAFINSMRNSISLAKIMIEKDSESIEGIFFDLHARAFLAMFWADNGKPSRVIRDIDNLYRNTMKGIDLKGRFNEFYFCSGLYNYYIEAYVELHPVYKPIAILFRPGDKKKGLMELQHAIDHTTYIKTEAILFMSLLQLNYELDIDKARHYAAILHNNFPDNIYYTGHYLMILAHKNEFKKTETVLNTIRTSNDDYARMIYTVMQGFVEENRHFNDIEAKKLYLRGINEAEEFGPFADVYQALCYAGLCRLSLKKNDIRSSNYYKRESKSHSAYRFILSYRSPI